MKSFGGLPVLILLSTKTLRGRVMNHKPGSGSFVDQSIRVGRKCPNLSSGSMALLDVEKPFYRKFSVSATAYDYKVD